MNTPDFAGIAAAPYPSGNTQVRRVLGGVAAATALLAGGGALLWSAPILWPFAATAAISSALMLYLAHMDQVAFEHADNVNVAALERHYDVKLRTSLPAGPEPLPLAVLAGRSRTPLLVHAAVTKGRAALFFDGAEYSPRAARTEAA